MNIENYIRYLLRKVWGPFGDVEDITISARMAAIMREIHARVLGTFLGRFTNQFYRTDTYKVQLKMVLDAMKSPMPEILSEPYWGKSEH